MDTDRHANDTRVGALGIVTAALLVAVVLAGCGEATQEVPPAAPDSSGAAVAAGSVPRDPDKDVYFGAFHVHTGYSFDAYTNGTPTVPDDAFRWARGEAIDGGGDGTPLQIKVPLDWYAVSDHAEYLGVFRLMEDADSPLAQLPIAARVTSDDSAVAFGAFRDILQDMSEGRIDPQLADPEVGRSIWSDVVSVANAHDEPGTFTAFPAFEWTSNPSNRNLHRVVIFGGADEIPGLPFSAFDSDRPEDLWAWMDDTRAAGARLLAIPHNGNASDGLMFPETTSYGGSTLTREFAEQRMRNEPLYEITQIKGTSETHPALSPNDEFASFELWEYVLGADADPATVQKGSYVRDALIRGLALEQEGKGNPFKYGFVGDTDTHNAAASHEEDNYTGKFAFENDTRHRLLGAPGFAEPNVRQVQRFSSGGIAGIWAQANTRDALFDSLEQRETFATTGPRMKVRFFGGRDFAADALGAPGWVANAYAAGVPMGGDLPAGEGAPSFLIWATAETDGANLDRVQVVKGWVEDGAPQERIYDVALADGRTPAQDGAVASVGNTVDVATATFTNAIGDPELKTVWTDPDFDPAVPAFWYVRVLQIPTPRWSTYDAARLGVEIPDGLPVSIQERAWTSPIWYSP